MAKLTKYDVFEAYGVIKNKGTVYASWIQIFTTKEEADALSCQVPESSVYSVEIKVLKKVKF